MVEMVEWLLHKSLGGGKSFINGGHGKVISSALNTPPSAGGFGGGGAAHGHNGTGWCLVAVADILQSGSGSTMENYEQRLMVAVALVPIIQERIQSILPGRMPGMGK